MNREQARMLKKKGFSQKAIMDRYRKEAVDQGFGEGIRHTQTVIMMMTAWVLHEHLGLGPKRLPEIMNLIKLNIECFGTGHLTKLDIPTIKKELKKCGCDYNI